MRQFTFKDFILYNSPCFSCGNKVNFQLIASRTSGSEDSHSLRARINGEVTELDLAITYNSTLKLGVFNKSNRIICTTPVDLKRYLIDYNLMMELNCSHCRTHIETRFLEFNLDRGFIKPVGIAYEYIQISEKETMYRLQSDFRDPAMSKLYVCSAEMGDFLRTGNEININLPLIPMYSFKNREHFLNKIKTYVVFS
jgi:hypothetical protein